MDKLYIPKGCTIGAESITICNEGDIVIENDMPLRELISKTGSIRYQPGQGDVVCEHVEGENGLVEIEADSFRSRTILAQSAHLRIKKLEVEGTLASRSELVVEAGSMRVEHCQGERIELKADQLEVTSIEALSEVVIHAGGCKAKSIRAGRVIVNGSLECNQVIAEETVVVNSGKVSIKSLESPSFQAAPEVQGIVMVANCEDVKAQGVRGFLYPSELGMLAEDQDVASMPTADLTKKEMNMDDIDDLTDNDGDASDNDDFGDSGDSIIEHDELEAVADEEEPGCEELVEEPGGDDFEELSGEFHAAMHEIEAGDSEEALTRDLTALLVKIRGFFNEDNYPNSLNQIQHYVDARRFTPFAKDRNKEALLSNFDQFNHAEISRLAREFFKRLDAYLENNS